MQNKFVFEAKVVNLVYNILYKGTKVAKLIHDAIRYNRTKTKKHD